MSQVYSTRFFAVQGLSGSLTYTVPAGYVASVKHIDVYCNTLGGASFTFVGSASQTIYWNDFNDTSGPPYGWWDGMAVFYEGETMTIKSYGHPMDVTISGYLLATS